jgi:hypothetical protein
LVDVVRKIADMVHTTRDMQARFIRAIGLLYILLNSFIDNSGYHTKTEQLNEG